ncbi:MAG TPA: lysophospholipid acyltransferase family protein [Opitutaceae bacterium]
MRYVLPEVALATLSSLRLTWRIRETGRKDYDSVIASGQAPVIAYLHGRAFMLLDTISDRRGRSWYSMCSTSLDGDAMARVGKKLGFEVVRGSSGNGGAQAIVDIIYALRDDPRAGACIAIDGSRGPRGHAKGGIIALAQRTGRTVIPVTISASSAWICRKAWDRTLIAKPFARVEVVFGEKLDVPKKLTAHEFERLRADIEGRLTALQARADELSGFADTEPVRAPATLNPLRATPDLAQQVDSLGRKESLV